MNIEKLHIANIVIAMKSSADKQITEVLLRSCISGLLHLNGELSATKGG